MTMTEEGIAITKQVSDQLREYIDKLPKIFSDNDKKELLKSLEKFRNCLEKEVEMNI